MAANIDTMMHVGELPWHGLSTDMTANPPKTSEEIIRAAKLEWTVATTPMVPVNTDIKHAEKALGYHAVYREDTSTILGVVKRTNPMIVQNSDTFHALDKMIDKSLDVETAASLGAGETIFGCFKIRENYRLLDDDIAHYFVVVNDHLNVDGKVTVLNTPVRVVCQNTLSEALSNNIFKVRVPITTDGGINSTIAATLSNAVQSAITKLKQKSEDMVSKKIDQNYIDTMMDILFPYHVVDGQPMISPANEKVSMIRTTFMDKCMGADNLANYQGTQWQMFNALTDFTQHMFTKVDHAYDLDQRMKRMPGVTSGAETNKVVQFLKAADKIAA